MSRHKLEREHSPTLVHRVNVSAYVNKSPPLSALHGEMLRQLIDKDFQVTHWHPGQTRAAARHEFHLDSLEENVVTAADAFVFLPLPHVSPKADIHQPVRLDIVRQFFKLASLHVGVQTNDPHMQLRDAYKNPIQQKPIVLYDPDRTWQPFLDLLEHLRKPEVGTVGPQWKHIIEHVTDGDIEKVIDRLHVTAHAKKPPTTHITNSTAKSEDKLGREEDGEPQPFNVCVFCSASTRNPNLLELARNLGKEIALQDWGLISGMGCTGMMGMLMEGATEVKRQYGKGWTGGSNLMRIIDMEGLPEEYDTLWIADDIYQRMELMIKNSDAFIIMPGGMGTVQELATLLLMKYDPRPLQPGKLHPMHGKPVIIMNPDIMVEGKRMGFWDPLIDLLRREGFHEGRDFDVVKTPAQAMESLAMHKEGLKEGAGLTFKARLEDWKKQHSPLVQAR